ncbi:MAG: A/G-specific adenine glycosylase [Gammaproteobacteria bacterium]|nr:A/G-specific adenine glycosylase [Gammaproteobacteria bacterium]MDE0248226.1 A/G-specific adenine glycosylase [Gammaproteobacteria bacterium]
MPGAVASLRAALLTYFRQHARSFPWRSDSDPYRVLVSEVMLQQTRAAVVSPYFERWMQRFPTISVLADASEEEVLKAWEGLGYYSRALRLRRAAREIVRRHGGRVPATADVLRTLPGIGPYTAGAVASIAYGSPVPAVDANARRVIARLMNEPKPPPRMLEEWAGALVDPADPGGFNQALMELGARICLPSSPRCGECPILGHCRAREAGTQAAVPTRRPRAPLPEYTVACAGLVSREGKSSLALLRRRPPGGLLGGMWEVPGEAFDDPAEAGRVASELAGRLVGAGRSDRADRAMRGMPVRIGPMQELRPVRHEFTHRRVTYLPFAFEVSTVDWFPDLPGPYRWVSRVRARELPMGVAQRRLLKQLF